MIFDAYAVIALLGDEPAAEAVADLLRTHRCGLPATALAEVMDRAVRVHGKSADEVAVALHHLGLLDAVTVDSATALLAGRWRAKHHHRERRAVSLADCVVAAVARTREEPLATADPHLLDLCHEEGVVVEVLPGSDGSVWTPR